MRLSALTLLAIAALSMAANCFAQSSSSQTSTQEIPASEAPKSQSAVPQAPEVSDAEALLAKSDWKSAADKLAPYLAEHPGDDRALFDAGYAADALSQLDQAAAFYRRAVEANPKSFEAHLSLGLLLARQGKKADARPELATATTLDPGIAGTAAKARAWRALAQIDRSADPAQASTDLLEALKISPETPADTLTAAELADAAGRYDDAEAAYRRLLKTDPKSAPANAGLAHLMIVRKQYPEAETFLRTALQNSPEDLSLNAQMATVLAAQDKAEALPLLQKLHTAHPDNSEITRMLADVTAQAGDPVASDKLYAALLAAHPDDPALLVAHGQNLIRQLKYPEAFSAFSRATELDPANPDAWSGLAFAASTTHQPQTTIKALTMRSKYVADIPSTYFLWATSYDTLHDKAAAISYYHRFLDSAAGKFPNQEWQARQRLLLLEKKH